MIDSQERAESPQAKSSTPRLQVAVSGSSGLVGSKLAPLLSSAGHQVMHLVRREARDAGEIRWDPAGADTDTAALEGVDVIVHLAGENIAGKRWNDAVKQRIRDSRVQATQKLCEAIAKFDKKKPSTLICASAIGYYGDRGDELLDETSSAGTGFLADVVKDWEAATSAASEAGIRVVNLRFGVILSPDGGALKQMLTPFKLGGGGRIGTGSQFWSWISLDDAACAIYHALNCEALSGPTNVTAPNPVTNAEFTKVLGKVLRRPTIFPMPAFAARMALGEMANDLILASLRVQPKLLLDTGYSFQHSDLEVALRHVLGK